MSFSNACALSFPRAAFGALALLLLAPLGTGQCQVDKLAAVGGSTLDDFGSAVAIDGGFAAVAQRGDDYAGSVWTFAFTSAGWVRTGEILPGDGFAGQRFGASLSLSGRTLLVGAPTDDDSGPAAGAVYVYFRDEAGTPSDPSDDTWLQVDKLFAVDPAPPTHFGSAVALDGNLAVVGAEGLANGPSAAYSLTRDDNGTPGVPGDDTWTQDAILAPDGSSALTTYGASVALDGIELLVGDPRDDTSGTAGGAVYVYQQQASGDGTSWLLEDKWVPDGESGVTRFGTTIDVHEGVAIVGAPGYTGPSDGWAFLYERIGPTSGWGAPLALDNPSFGLWSSFGHAVAVEDGRVLVSSTLLSFMFYSGVRVWGWEKVGGVWSQTIDLQMADQALGDHFGESIAMSGPMALIGCTGYVGVSSDDFIAPYEGAAGLFALDTPSPWTDLGFAHGPESPLPHLGAWGTLEELKPITLKLHHAWFDSAVALVIGFDSAYIPFKGGTMVPQPDVIVSGLVSDAIGELSFTAPWLRNSQVPTGTRFVFQYWIAVPSFSYFPWWASNGLEAVQP